MFARTEYLPFELKIIDDINQKIDEGNLRLFDHETTIATIHTNNSFAILKNVNLAAPTNEADAQLLNRSIGKINKRKKTLFVE